MGEALANVMECSHWLQPPRPPPTAPEGVSVAVPMEEHRRHFPKSFAIVLDFFWRFSPDVVAASVGLCMSPFNSLRTRSAYLFFRFLGVPLLFSLFIYLSTMQRGEARKNISRFFCESPLLRFMGFCSFTIYLLQPVAFGWYAHLLGMRSYFAQQNEGLKFVGISILFAFCFLIQYFYQDILISKLYISTLNWLSKPAQKSTQERSAVKAPEVVVAHV